MSKIAYKRILLKISGEILQGDGDSLFSPAILAYLNRELTELQTLGTEIAIVLGGGNILRGREAQATGMDRVRADYMGMLATIMNGMALTSSLEQVGLKVRHFTSLPLPMVAELFQAHAARASLAQGNIVICSGGTGNPFFSTDSASSLRAAEIGADIIIKATKVDGVYDKDPVKFSDAKKFESIDFRDVLNRGLQVMDLTAISQCQEQDIPIVVVKLMEKGNLTKVVLGEKIGTYVGNLSHSAK
jgi:uridylate kinase